MANTKRVCFILVFAITATVTGQLYGEGGWTQWGGPRMDFVAGSTGLASSWEAGGPPRIWQRELGEGYSAILVDNGRLYTMYRHGDNESVVALDAKSGTTAWTYEYAAAPREGHVDQFGRGPRSTPLISGDRIYTIGVSGIMNALSIADGKMLWSHDLWGKELGGNFLNHGYSSSPIAFGETIITLVGGENASVVAFDRTDGSIVWKAQSFENSYSTPQILEVGGRQQLITFMASHVIGINPTSGELHWSYPHENQWKQNVNMPSLLDGEYLFLSSPQVGARGLRLTSTEGSSQTTVEELWSTRKIQFYHVTTVRDGEWVYGSTGVRAPAFMSAINIKTGEIGWRKRGFGKANVIAADGKILILDEDGKLSIATATPEDLIVLSEVELLDRVAWTVPTIVGKTMYVRDQKSIMALDLS